MEEKQKAEITAYIQGLSFGLKDFQATQQRHGAFKQSEFKNLIDSKGDEIKNHFQRLKNVCLYEDSDFLSKSSIRQYTTYLNGRVRFLNTEFIGGITNGENTATIDKYAIKFYLTFYTEINDIMKLILKLKFGEVSGVRE